MKYSTGCVSNYASNGCPNGDDLPLAVPEGEYFRYWYNRAGHQIVTSWNNGDVWGADFRDAGGTDLAPDGGSDIPDIYFFTGHGSCQNPPGANDPDYIITCGNFGTPNDTIIGREAIWGSLNGGNLKFAFIDASCPMDLVSLRDSWFPAFQGLHIATAHSGTADADTLDSADRGGQFAVLTAGGSIDAPFDLTLTIPQFSVGDAWMGAGATDIQIGCCAVALAAGEDRDDAIDRVNNEKITDGRSDPFPNWFAWRWVCVTAELEGGGIF